MNCKNSGWSYESWDPYEFVEAMKLEQNLGFKTVFKRIKLYYQ